LGDLRIGRGRIPLRVLGGSLHDPRIATAGEAKAVPPSRPDDDLQCVLADARLALDEFEQVTPKGWAG
jgi:hypothetical protein